MATKRIIDQPTDTALSPGDLIIVDSEESGVGTRKFDLGTELTDIKQDLGDLSELETSDQSSLVDAINEVLEVGGASGGIEVVSSISEMTNIHACYLLNTDGHWYYYDGSEWVDGGAFSGSSASLAQIASVIKRMIVISETEPTDPDVILWINPDDTNSYTTVTQVQNMIDTSLGVIENGTY